MLNIQLDRAANVAIYQVNHVRNRHPGALRLGNFEISEILSGSKGSHIQTKESKTRTA